jgi:hypothetical protein
LNSSFFNGKVIKKSRTFFLLLSLVEDPDLDYRKILIGNGNVWISPFHKEPVPHLMREGERGILCNEVIKKKICLINVRAIRESPYINFDYYSILSIRSKANEIAPKNPALLPNFAGTIFTFSFGLSIAYAKATSCSILI